MKRLSVGLSVGLLVGLLLSTTRVAWAAAPAPKGPVERRQITVFGEITAIDGDTLTIDAPRGEITLLTDDQTRYRIPEVDKPGLDDLHAGDRIAARGRWESRGVLHARLILVVPENARRLRGTVDEVSDDSLTLATPDGDVNVATDENTRVLVPGVEAPTLSDLEAGMPVIVTGLEDDAGNVVARAIKAVLNRFQGVASGQVTAIGDDTLSLDTRRGALTVKVDEQTRYRVPGVEEASLSDMSTGDRAVVNWVNAEDGTMRARIVAAIPQELAEHAVRGEIVALEGETLTLSTRRGEVIVHTDDQTRFLLPGIENPTIDDLSIGQTVGAVGRWNEDGSLQARFVGTRKAP